MSPNGVPTGALFSLQGLVNAIRNAVVGGLQDELDDLREAITSIPDAVGAGIDSARQSIENAVGGAVSAINANIGSLIDGVQDWLNKITTGITSAFSQAIGSLGEVVDDTIESVSDWLGDTLESLAKTRDQILTFVSDQIGGALRETWDGVKELATQIRDNIGKAVTEAGRLVRETYRNISDWLGSTLSNIRSNIETVAEQIRSTIADLIEALEKRIRELGDKFIEWWNETRKDLEDKYLLPLTEGVDEARELMQKKVTVLEKSLSGEYTSWEGFVNDVTDPVPLVGALGAVAFGLLVIPLFSGAMYGVTQPFMENLAQLGRERARSTLLQPDVLVNAVFRDIVSPRTAQAELAKAGFADERQNILIEASRPLASPGQVQMAFLRGEISEGEHDRELASYGFTPERIALFKSLYWVIPPIQDIIRMAVREAFTPEIAERFGQYEDLPEVFVEWAEKQGLSRDWAERYWASHWELPSPLQGFEMLHRGIIDENELKLLLRALDVMPFWRERLIQLSYRPLTRVDVRRMFRLGVLDTDGVYKSYLDLGYSPENARLMTEFTIRYETPEAEDELADYRKLTRSVIERAYKRGVIGRENASQRLQEIGYLPEDAEFLISIQDYNKQIELSPDHSGEYQKRLTKLLRDSYARRVITWSEGLQGLQAAGYSPGEAETELSFVDYEVSQRLRRLQFESVQRLYVERTIDNVEAVNRLSQMGFSSDEQETLFREWNIIRQARTEKLPRSTLDRLIKKGIINAEQYVEELRGLGYHDKYISWMLALNVGAA